MQPTQGVRRTYGERAGTYFVIAEGGAAPKVRHHSRVKAEAEARRLAEQNPNMTFHVAKLKTTLVGSMVVTSTKADRLADETAKQIVAREALPPGTLVVVKNGHHAFPGARGIVHRWGEDGDTSIYAQIANGAVTQEARFSPTSLLPAAAMVETA